MATSLALPRSRYPSFDVVRDPTVRKINERILSDSDRCRRLIPTVVSPAIANKEIDILHNTSTHHDKATYSSRGAHASNPSSYCPDVQRLHLLLLDSFAAIQSHIRKEQRLAQNVAEPPIIFKS